MLVTADIEGLSRGLAIAIPIAVLITLALLLRVSVQRRKARQRAENDRERPPMTADVSSDRKAPVNMAMLDAAAPMTASQAPTAFDATPQQPQAPASIVTPQAAGALLPDLIARLTSADSASQPALYLHIANAHHVLGDEGGRMTALRSAAGLAAIHGPRAVHARARLELAEAAFLAGDLTGACEQWQMARLALLEDGQKEASTRVDKRMRETGCPTDWVLTDF